MSGEDMIPDLTMKEDIVKITEEDKRQILFTLSLNVLSRRFDKHPLQKKGFFIY